MLPAEVVVGIKRVTVTRVPVPRRMDRFAMLVRAREPHIMPGKAVPAEGRDDALGAFLGQAGNAR